MRKDKEGIIRYWILVPVAAVLIFMRSFLMTYIIQPLTQLIWLVWSLARAVDQKIYWLLLIIICSIMVYRFASSRRPPSMRSAYREEGYSITRFEYWQMLINQAPYGRRSRKQLLESLQKLSMDLNGEEGAGEAELPRELQESMQDRGGILFSAARDVIALTPKWLRKHTKVFLRRDRRVVEEVFTYLESELEINHE